MTESTPITLPQSTPFPVTISSILYKQGDTVKKHATMFKYKYWDYQDDPNSKEQVPPKIRVERIGTFESPIEGEILKITVAIDEEIGHSGVELCFIKEPCNHAVQYGGLCALCGKAVGDEKDYSGYNYEDRASISMFHNNNGLKVSLDEAEKVEKSTTESLTAEKKLILVVDLDQTVIHATVDPTVGEWQRDPSNPNYASVKDVGSFCLEEEHMAPPGWTGPKLPPTKCWYYVKLRPGLAEFLKEVSKLYQLHIYTMATRNYALEIAKLIDPTGEYFGDRILSRDESGSLTHKNLKRLFPVDQSMVAIIDDRGDVWQWESNLIKVVPYDFFVGIGDINSSFLPKKSGQLTGPTKKRKSIAKLEQSLADAIKENKKAEEGKGEPETDKMDPDEENDKNLLMEQSLSRNQSIEQQQHDRPLAKLQNDLQKLHHEHDSSDSADSGEDDDDDENLLYDDDNELSSLQKVLIRIHSEYYNIYEQGSKNPLLKPDLIKIIPALKRKCLDGITILFSGIIQLGINPNSADIVIWSKQFGVKVVTEVVPGITHVICREPELGSGLTFKVRAARKMFPDVKIVNPDWLFSCLSSWSKVDEADYLIKGSEKDWIVDEKDIAKYKRSLEIQRKKENNVLQGESNYSTTISVEAYDLDEANQEVEDFLAGLSDEDIDEDEDNNENDDKNNEDNEDAPLDIESGVKFDSFIKDAYRNHKKRRGNDENDSQDPTVKKPRISEVEELEDLDELEKELMNGFDDLEG